MCDNKYPQKTAFLYLEDIKKIVFRMFTNEEIYKSFAYSFDKNKKFKNEIKDRMEYFNKNLNIESLSRLNQAVLDYKEDVIDSSQLQSILGDRINLVAIKSYNTVYDHKAVIIVLYRIEY